MTALDKRSLELEVDGIEVSAQISTGKITTAAASAAFVTFAVARAGGGREYHLVATGVQDFADGSFWDLTWSRVGEQVDFYMRPHGNGIPTTELPHFAGTVTIRETDGDLIGGDADADVSARQTHDVDWICTAKPAKIVSETDPLYQPSV